MNAAQYALIADTLLRVQTVLWLVAYLCVRQPNGGHFPGEFATRSLAAIFHRAAC